PDRQQVVACHFLVCDLVQPDVHFELGEVGPRLSANEPDVEVPRAAGEVGKGAVVAAGLGERSHRRVRDVTCQDVAEESNSGALPGTAKKTGLVSDGDAVAVGL